MISSGSGALRCARTDLSRPRYGQIYRPVFLRLHCTCTLSLPITQSIANWNYHYRRHYSSTFIACSYIPIMPIGGPQGHIMVIGLNIQLLPLRKKERKKIPTAVCVCVCTQSGVEYTEIVTSARHTGRHHWRWLDFCGFYWAHWAAFQQQYDRPSSSTLGCMYSRQHCNKQAVIINSVLFFFFLSVCV